MTQRAIVLSLEVQTTARPLSGLPFPSFRTALSCAVPPTATAAGEGVTVTEATDAAAAGAGVFAAGVSDLGRPNRYQPATPTIATTNAMPIRRVASMRRGAA